MVEEEIARDEARVEEYRAIYTGVTLKAPRTAELRTGIIPAARFADKIRRVALAAFKGYVPRDIIVRDVSEFNRRLYDTIVNEMKCAKTDLIRVTVDVAYDEENGRLIFGEPVIDRFVPEREVKAYYEELLKAAEAECKKRIEELETKVRKLEEERHDMEEFKRKVLEVARRLEELLR